MTTGAANIEILAWEETPLGLLCLRRRALLGRPGTTVTEITLEHELLMSSYVTTSESALAEKALAVHDGEALRVLVGGLGLGYTALRVLQSGGDRVARLEVVEYLPQVIDWLERGMLPTSAELTSDRRVAVVEGDVYARLAEPPGDDGGHDLILIDVDHSPGEQLGDTSAPFYTKQGLEQARRHLAPDGVLAVWSYAEDSAFAGALREAFSEVRVEPVTVVNDLVDEEQTDWLFIARK